MPAKAWPPRPVNKPYNVTSVAAAPSQQPVPANPKRVSLIIQNTGANVGYVRFGTSTQGVGLDFEWTAGFLLKWDQADTCPKEGINLSSVAGTTWAIMEGIWPGQWPQDEP
jgi:hypothetical protein